jgi:hypothetical protein
MGEMKKDIFGDLIQEGRYSQVVFGDKKVACRPIVSRNEPHIHGLAFGSLKNPKLDDNEAINQDDLECVLTSLMFKDSHSVDVVIQWLKAFQTNVFGQVV